jgi:hypothetical protein
LKGERAAGPVEDDEPATENVDNVVEEIGIRDAIESSNCGESEKEEFCDVSWTVSSRQS